MKTLTKEAQSALTPKACRDLLVAGNKRFTEKKQVDRDHLEKVSETSHGQFPFAIVLSCVDSRVPAELVFDQTIGDIFSARVAGNVVNGDILGSMEFACKLAGSKLIVVLGHTSCGAVKGACGGAELGNLTGLLAKIKPAIDIVDSAGPLDEEERVQKVAEMNVEVAIKELRAKSFVLDDMIKAGEIGVVGGMYSLTTGEVVLGDLICGS